jgi:peptide methionine sulfoxide reductase MsrA
MSDDYFGFNVGKVLIEVIKVLKERELLKEEEILDILWEAKDPHFPWDKRDIKDLLKL